MAKQSQNKARRVLAAAEEVFAKYEEDGRLPVLSNAGSALGAVLGMPAAEVAVLLRQLHRNGRIGLVNGVGEGTTSVHIARSQDCLLTGYLVETKGGGTKTVVSHSRPSTREDPDPTEEARLRAENEQLNLQVSDLTGKLEKSTRHLTTANSEREEARRGQREAEEKLGAAQVTIRRLEAEARTYRDNAERRIKELEEQLELAGAQEQNILRPEVLEALQSLKSSQQSD